VIGTKDKLTLPDLVEAVKERRRTGDFSVLVRNETLEGATFEKMCITHAPRTRAYVKIEDGCECKCTYCAISGARGRVRSKPVEDVISEVEGLYAKGTREIVLTGIETGSYGRDFDFKYTLADLIVQLDKRGSCERLRLGSLAPELVGEEFVRKVKGTKILAPHFHLSMQSGSDRILALMKRRYNSAMALKNIERIRENIPGAQFTTDLMVGFPGEREEDFIETVEFVRRAGFIDAHVFAYSKRDGTPAKDFKDQIPSDVKRQRSNMLIKVKNEVRDSVLEKIVLDKEPLICVAESYDTQGYTSHSDSFAEVYFKAEEGLSGRRVTVMPASHKNGVIIGELINLI
jgi:threonylcarbamoyladenosine tRNA methylthiotransferase MtaB